MVYLLCKGKETSNTFFIQGKKTFNVNFYAYAPSVNRKLEALRLAGIFL